MSPKQSGYFSEGDIPNDRPFISDSSVPPMPSNRNPINLQNNNRLKKIYLKDDHVYLSDSDFSDDDENIQFPYNTTVSKYHKNGVLDNFIGKKKTVTFVMPKKDAKILRRAKKYAKRLDSGIPVGGINIPIDPLVGFVPIIGDFAGVFLGLGFIGIAQKGGLDKKVYSKMIGNLVVDSAVGFISVIGDIADFFHKANLKNFKILEKYFIKRSKAFTKMLNGQMEPQAFYNKYKSFASHHKKDVMFIHEHLGIPLPTNMNTKYDPLPESVGPDDDLEEIENTDGLIVGATENCPNCPEEHQHGVIVTSVETSDNANNITNDKKHK
ncbi:hypothetical protein BCR36DRAFT_342116 [Piromyces finnis]|uniref:DUF4112 domain-containing protein n=1 Tax=Piromyces finnis TaxID=1754191 RepID=A0A1Y1VLZ5_9FUNG|nr:hypothetical protein BCR36DRAFT_342116 [Piromyces finnis]|eukprot:ORX59954.1 hypothetical protein BCR36DRAFT_342116 [Piromyces finnis]